jgi:hypothetical protein
VRPKTSAGNAAAALARLIQKVYEVDPLVCPDCGGRLEVIAFINAPQAIRKILEHLGLWALSARPPPVPLVQSKIDALHSRSNGNRLCPAEHADGVFIDDVRFTPDKDGREGGRGAAGRRKAGRE